MRLLLSILFSVQSICIIGQSVCSVSLVDPDALITADQIIEASQLTEIDDCGGSGWIQELTVLACPSGYKYIGMRSSSGLYLFNYSDQVWFDWCFESEKGKYYQENIKGHQDCIIHGYNENKSICKGWTKGGDRCSRLVDDNYCWQHN